MEKPIIRLFKKAEQTRNKIIIPKSFCEKFGYDYYLEIYNDYIKLVPKK